MRRVYGSAVAIAAIMLVPRLGTAQANQEASRSVAGGGMIREVETVVMPAGQSSITVDAKTADPVVLVPAQR